MLRLNKYLSEAGVCSRREADRLIEQGRVKVDGTPATVGMQVDEHAQITVDGKAVGEKKQKTILIAVNKPRGIVCSEAHQGNDTNIIEFLQYPKRITYMGRLDKDSEGLLLMTNRGDLINEMMRAAHYHEKEYEVVVDRPFTDRFLNDLAAGVYLKELDVTTRPCQVQRLGKRKFSIVLTQGLNRQIRRMCGELGSCAGAEADPDHEYPSGTLEDRHLEKCDRGRTAGASVSAGRVRGRSSRGSRDGRSRIRWTRLPV